MLVSNFAVQTKTKPDLANTRDLKSRGDAFIDREVAWTRVSFRAVLIRKIALLAFESKAFSLGRQKVLFRFAFLRRAPSGAKATDRKLGPGHTEVRQWARASSSRADGRKPGPERAAEIEPTSDTSYEQKNAVRGGCYTLKPISSDLFFFFRSNCPWRLGWRAVTRPDDVIA